MSMYLWNCCGASCEPGSRSATRGWPENARGGLRSADTTLVNIWYLRPPHVCRLGWAWLGFVVVEEGTTGGGVVGCSSVQWVRLRGKEVLHRLRAPRSSLVELFCSCGWPSGLRLMLTNPNPARSHYKLSANTLLLSRTFYAY